MKQYTQRIMQANEDKLDWDIILEGIDELNEV